MRTGRSLALALVLSTVAACSDRARVLRNADEFATFQRPGVAQTTDCFLTSANGYLDSYTCRATARSDGAVLRFHCEMQGMVLSSFWGCHLDEGAAQ